MKAIRFTVLRFCLIVIAIMAVYIGLFSLLLFYPDPPRAVQYQSIGDLLADDPVIIPTILYLTFIMGWGIAYSVFFRFPRNFKVLLVGIFIGGLILATVLSFDSGNMNNPYISPPWLKFLYSLLAGCVGSAFQLLFVAGALQLVKAFWKKFFTRRASAIS